MSSPAPWCVADIAELEDSNDVAEQLARVHLPDEVLAFHERAIAVVRMWDSAERIQADIKEQKGAKARLFWGMLLSAVCLVAIRHRNAMHACKPRSGWISTGLKHPCQY